MHDTPQQACETDVLVIGGGPVGLVSSLLLSDLGIAHVVVERRDGTSSLPKAHYLNSRSMEILASVGMAKEVYEAGAGHVGGLAWYTSLAPEGELVMRQDGFGSGTLSHAYSRDSAHSSGNLPQKHLEPRLRRAAEEKNPGNVRFQHEVISLAHDTDGVTAVVRSAEGESEIRARYAIAADGGRTVAAAAGIAMSGHPPLGRAVALHFAAELSHALRKDDDSWIRLINRVTDDGTMLEVALVAMGPTKWDRHCEEWVLNVIGPADDASTASGVDHPTAIATIREVLGLPELDVEMLGTGGWTIESVLADRYRTGPVFLVGDAAHRFPPTGGLGLNTGIADTHNLAWKLAAVLQDSATDTLLDSYERERRPVAARNIEWAMLSALNHLTTTQAAWGVVVGAPPAQNLATFQAVMADGADGATRRARLRELLFTLRPEWQHHDIELGYSYEDGATLADGTPAKGRDPMGLDHVPGARPGDRAPHAWFERNGTPTTTHHLIAPGRFLLLAGRNGAAWHAAARHAKIEIAAYAVGSDLLCDRDWHALCEISDTGAILIRPDGHVAMRAIDDTEADALLDSAITAAHGHAI